MRTRIGTRLILGVGLVTSLAIGSMAVFVIRAHRQELIGELTRSADQLSETIKSSTHHDMLENRRDAVHRQIETIGRQEGIDRVRVFNKDGRVMYSSDAAEIGLALDKRAESCYACHAEGRPLERLSIPARTRIFDDAEGRRSLGIINPIHNEPSCWSAACHAHPRDASVLGVLDVTMSLAEVDRKMASTQWRLAGLAAVAVAGSSLLLGWLNRRLVIVPTRALLEGTRRVADGDMAVAVPAPQGHELGELARAFNTMTAKLADARRQLTQADRLAAVGSLAAGVAHEINNPLTGVLTSASLLLQRKKDDPALREELEVIVRETIRCREIVKGLLDFARPKPPRRQPTDVNDVVRRAVGVVMNRLALSRIGLRLDLGDGLPEIPADPHQLEQVLVNVLLNAADAIGEDGSVRLASRRVALEPRGHAPIRRAACPRGCDLLDPTVRIAGLSAITVLRESGGREAALHLAPVYGRYGHVASEPCEEGVVATVRCPRCRTDLCEPERRCERCGGPTFGVEVAEAGRVRWCSRNGCHWSSWPVLDAAGPRDMLELEVEDDGAGIPPENLPRLFDPFFTTKGARGSGLGLAVSWGIVDAHGGAIEVQSEPGRGSVFVVRLPIDPAHAWPAGRPAAAASPSAEPLAVATADVAPRSRRQGGTS